MIKKLFLSLILVFTLAVMSQATTIPPGPFTYWIVGTVNDVNSIMADSRTVVFYKDDATYNTNFSTGVISGNQFMLNAPYIWPLGLEVGTTYKAAIIQGNDGYGADPVDVTISGVGYEEVNNLVLAYGAGPGAPGAELPPQFQVWFGNRLYQPAIYGPDRPFVVAAQPDIKVQISIDEPYSLASDISSYAITVDPGTATEKALTLSSQHMSQKIFAAAAELRSFALEYTVEDALAEGDHTFEFSATSSGALGTATAASTQAAVEVMGGELRLIGLPLTYPSPYSITKDKIVTIQYTLSMDANIDIYLIDPTGKRIKKLTCDAGTEGGSAGVNKVTWNGMTDMGYLAGNAIYIGTIIGRDESRLLAKVKMTIVD
ncbi:MAG: hypothetical protein KJ732_00510 [Candidatus Margulisbacteria bacterium]|nr:hypothetical protein [Candidatus Margulisiibacteriota bacterium]